MTWWDRGVDAFSQSQSDLDIRSVRWPLRRRVPLAILGASGAGKTALWRTLTGREVADQMSLATDEGYFAPQNSRTALALMTVPGQACADQYTAMDFLFGSQTALNGIIFVATFGFDYIWPRNVEAIAREMANYNLDSLRSRNVRRELDALRKLADAIKRKATTCPPEQRPGWLLIAVNKVDLYALDVGDARNYYRDGDSSQFVQLLHEIETSLGTLANFRIEHLPLAITPGDYVVDSSRGRIVVSSTLGDSQCRSSVGVLMELLEELT